MRKRSVKRRKGVAASKRIARLYHFEPKTVEHIEFLSTVFGGKERGIAAAIEIAAQALKGERTDLQISVR